LTLKTRLRRLERQTGIKPKAPLSGLEQRLREAGITMNVNQWIDGFLERQGLGADAYAHLDDDGRELRPPPAWPPIEELVKRGLAELESLPGR
jgi:hypothetical protein